jgi:hypothetical protein
MFEHKQNDETYEHFSNTRPSGFRKSRNAKFQHNINKDNMIDGFQSDKEFTNKFANINQQNDTRCSSRCKTCDVTCIMTVADSLSRPTYDVCQEITTELADHCVAKLNFCKPVSWMTYWLSTLFMSI